MAYRRGFIGIRSATKRQATSSLLALVAVFCLLSFFPSFAQASTVTLECVSPPRTVSARGITTLVFRITNQQASADTFGLEFTLPEGFLVLTAPSSVPLAAGEEKVVLVSLFAGVTVPAGSYEITLRTTSEADPTQFAEAQTTVAVEQKAGVELRLPRGRQSFAGQEMVYDIVVVNRGNDIDTFQVEAHSRWRLEVSQDVFDLFPGERADLTLTIYISQDARPGEEDYCYVTVSSRSDPTASEKGSIETLVIPPPPEAVRGSLFPMGRGTVKGTCSWSGDTLSSTVDWSMYGTMTKGTYIDIDGKFGIGVADGIGLEGGQVEYRTPDWRVTVGAIAFPGALSTDTVSIDYRYTPVGSPYSFKFYRDIDESSLDLCWKWSGLSFGIALSNGDFTVSSSISTSTIKMGLSIQESGFSVSLTPASYMGFSFSGSLTHASDKDTISFSPACGPFSGKLSLTTSESTRTTTFAPQFSTSLVSGWKVKGSLEFERERSDTLHTVDTEAVLCLSHSGSPFSGSLTTTFTSSADLLTDTEYKSLTVEGDTTFRFGPGWTLSIDTTLSQRLGTTDDPTSSVQLGFGIPIHSDSWRASFKLNLGSSQEGTASLSVSAQGMSLDVSVSKSCFSLSLGARFETPLPFVKTKGRIEGIVFIDKNLNGRLDSGEEGPAGLLLHSDGERAVTGTGGAFRFYPQPAGTYQLKIINLPEGYCIEPYSPSFELRVGETKSVQIRLVPTVSISGQVVVYRTANSLNGNGWNNNGQGGATSEVNYVADRPLSGALVVLTNGVATHKFVTGSTGAFFFQGLHSGDWTLRVELPDISPPHYVEHETYTLDLEPGEHRDLEIRVLPELRMIRPLGEVAPPFIGEVTPPLGYAEP